MKGSNRQLFMEAHYEVIQEWKADHPNDDMDEAYQATRFMVYTRYRENWTALMDEAGAKAKELIDNLELH